MQHFAIDSHNYGTPPALLYQLSSKLVLQIIYRNIFLYTNPNSITPLTKIKNNITIIVRINCSSISLSPFKKEISVPVYPFTQ